MKNLQKNFILEPPHQLNKAEFRKEIITLPKTSCFNCICLKYFYVPVKHFSNKVVFKEWYLLNCVEQHGFFLPLCQRFVLTWIIAKHVQHTKRWKYIVLSINLSIKYITLSLSMSSNSVKYFVVFKKSREGGV